MSFPSSEKTSQSRKCSKWKKKGLMATWDYSDSSEDESDEEQANMALMESIKAFDEKIQSDLE